MILSQQQHSRLSSIRQQQRAFIITGARKGNIILYNNNNNAEETKETTTITKLGKKQGVYTRPSAAIERGSGFYVPGLEGPKVRLLFGTLFILLIGINHYVSSESLLSNNDNNSNVVLVVGNNFSEILAIIYGLLVLIQGIVQYRKETIQSDIEYQKNSIISYKQQWTVPIDDDNNNNWKNKVEWAARSYAALTPCTHMVLVGPGAIVFSYGISDINNNNNDNNISLACQAAIDTVIQSKSGRVSLPIEHPTYQLLAAPMSSRCVILQKINEQLCWIMISDQLLPAFQPKDLKWLGQLAKYINPIE